MFVNVAEEGALDHLLGAHGRHPREHGTGLRELGVGEAAHDRGMAVAFSAMALYCLANASPSAPITSSSLVWSLTL